MTSRSPSPGEGEEGSKDTTDPKLQSTSTKRQSWFDQFITATPLKEWTTQVASLPAVEKYWSSNLAFKTLMAGGVAGAVSRTTVAPLERLKIIYQVQAQTPGHTPKYSGIFHSLKIIWQEEGIRGYFKGNGVNCVRIFPTSAIQFYTYESYKRVSAPNAIPSQKLPTPFILFFFFFFLKDASSSRGKHGVDAPSTSLCWF